MNWKINFFQGWEKIMRPLAFPLLYQENQILTLLYEDIDVKKKWDAVCKADKNEWKTKKHLHSVPLQEKKNRQQEYIEK